MADRPRFPLTWARPILCSAIALSIASCAGAPGTGEGDTATSNLSADEQALAEGTIQGADEAIAANPKDEKAYFDKLKAQMDLGRNDAALETADAILAIAPKNATVLVRKGDILRRLDRAPEALAAYQQATVARPKLDRAWGKLAREQAGQRQFDAALDSINRAIKLKPDDGDYLLTRGEALLQLKKPDDALKDLEKVIALQPANARAIARKADALVDLKRFDDALAAAEGALALEADNTTALVAQGDAFRGKKQRDEARQAYEAALETRPDAEYIQKRLAALQDQK